MKFLKVLFSLPIIVAGMLTFTMAMRAGFLRCLSFFGNLGLRLFPGVYNALDEQNIQYGSGFRAKEKYRDKETFNNLLIKAEKLNMKVDRIVNEIGNIYDSKCVDTDFSLKEIFDNRDPDQEVAVQYSGGIDSTLVALLAAQYFNRVHLLSFYHPFIRNREKGGLNVAKLRSVFGQDKIEYNTIDSTETFKKLVFDNYCADLIKYKTFILGIGCLACKLSFDVNIIRYASKHDISLVLDGADLSVRSQLSQGDENILRRRHILYAANGIEFAHPAAKFGNNSYELFKRGIALDPAQIIYAEQPECLGNQFLNEIYDRYYFLPRFGIEVHSQTGLKWLEKKLIELELESKG